MNIRDIFPSLRLLGLALVVTLLAGIPAFIGYRIAVEDHSYTTTAAQKGKAPETVVHHFHYTQVPSFWLPLAILAALVVISGIMLFVSHDRSRLVPGAAIGVAVVAAVAFAAVKFMPEHIDVAAVWRGGVCTLAGLFTVGLVAIGMHLAHLMGKRS